MEFSEGSRLSLILQSLAPAQKLLAVSKLQPPEKIKALYELGQRDFGENYIQEALGKIEKLPLPGLCWHLVGPIQKNKVKFLKNHFTYIHSVGSLELAALISEHALRIGHVQKVFLQLNLAAEESKSGFSRESFARNWDLLKKLAGLEIVGLMTMPPLENKPEKNRVFFKELKYIGSKLNLSEYSMGTSHDYHIALEEGATWIRLGTMLFGERTPKDSKKEI